MKSTAITMEQETAAWTLSWQPDDGCCNIFTREAILAHAPAAAGVYGLFNFDCQIFIGETANIQHALLRHESETEFQSRHLKPTGFTFETCAIELGKRQADELIDRFRPVLQTELALSERRSRSNGPMVNDADRDEHKREKHIDVLKFPVHEGEDHWGSPRPQRAIKRFDLPAAFFATISFVIFYFAFPANESIQKPANGAHDTPGPAESNSQLQYPSSSSPLGTLPNLRAGLPPAKPDSRPSAMTPNNAGRVATKSTATALEAEVRTPMASDHTKPLVDAWGRTNLQKKWFVQVSASSEREIAESLVRQLVAKGYSGYVIQAVVKGQTYNRVRVGFYEDREEAEATRQSLALHEGYRDAYLASD